MKVAAHFCRNSAPQGKDRRLAALLESSWSTDEVCGGGATVAAVAATDAAAAFTLKSRASLIFSASYFHLEVLKKIPGPSNVMSVVSQDGVRAFDIHCGLLYNKFISAVTVL